MYLFIERYLCEEAATPLNIVLWGGLVCEVDVFTRNEERDAIDD
jgi:hypothetical protein